MSTILDYMRNADQSLAGQKKVLDLPNGNNSKVLKPQLESNMGKQIMQNMESVMKSLKRRSKHRKHRQKRATQGLQPAEAEMRTENVSGAQAGDDGWSEEESLASLKQTWLSTRPKRKSADHATLTDHPDRRNAFQMLMLSGKASHNSASNDENNGKAVSPDVGKRRLSSGKKEQVKRRKVKSAASSEDQPPPASAVSPKSPVKKRQRQKLFECYVETVEAKRTPESPQVLSVTPNSTPSRPRRSCASKVNYKDDTSPVSATPTIKNPRADKTSTPSRATPKTDASPLIIDVEDSSIQDENTSPKTPVIGTGKAKFAPLFYKAVPKPTEDPMVREARQTFLKSDIPEKMRQEIEKKRQTQDEVNARQLCLYPDISHVPICKVYLADYDEEILFPRPDPWADPGPSPSCTSSCVLRVRVDDPSANGESLSAMAPLNTESQKKHLARNLKASSSDGKFPVYKFYKWLAKRVETPEEVAAPFPHQFRPTHSKEFVFNLSAVNELREYLEGFSAAAETVSSYETDDEYSNSLDALGSGGNGRQTLVLHGDCSSGKTSAVYAIAEELNYNVIEINASSKRNGAKVLHKLMEATQSHKVATTTTAKAKLSLSRKVLRRMEREEKKMSIILIEDVDVIFADDNGFLTAITQLMTLTKRPIIMTTNNRNSPNLRKTFDAHQNFKFLHFRQPQARHTDDTLMFLHLVGVVHGCNFDPDYLRHLFDELCHRDLRQALLQLNIITQTKDVELRWSGETSKIAIPCCNLEGEVEAEGDCTDLARIMDNLCAADRWSGRGRRKSALDANFQEMCLLGRRALDTRYDGTFYRKTGVLGTHSIARFTNRQTTTSSKVIAQDVDPLLRTICRSELGRKEAQRSSSKFLHHLSRDRDPEPPFIFGSGQSTNEDLEFFLESCSAFSPTECRKNL